MKLVISFLMPFQRIMPPIGILIIRSVSNSQIRFIAKKVEYILQEIFARLTIYNFCERIITTIAIQQKNRKYTYQTNFTVAVFICREYFRDRIHPSDLVALIRKNILPIREGRKAPRKVRPNSSKQLLI